MAFDNRFIIVVLYPTYIDTGEVSGVCNGKGETHISCSAIFPALSTSPGVEELLGSAAEDKNLYNV